MSTQRNLSFPEIQSTFPELWNQRAHIIASGGHVDLHVLETQGQYSISFDVTGPEPLIAALGLWAENMIDHLPPGIEAEMEYETEDAAAFWKRLGLA